MVSDGFRLGCTILGSGSRGNATVIHCPEGDLLLDAGFSARELEKRLHACSIAPDSIRAILVTHEHNDHIKGVRVFANSYGIPVFMTTETCRALRACGHAPDQIVLTSPGTGFEVCGVFAEPFSVSHDVADAVAYTFRANGRKLGYATDLGHMNLLAKTKLTGCDILVLESNYDPAILRDSARPLQLKRRIMGRLGHLSNQDAMSALSDLLTETTRELVFAHLSHECNRPDLVMALALEHLLTLARQDISPRIAMQDNPLETIWI